LLRLTPGELRPTRRLTAAALCLFVLVPAVSRASDWPNYRGPHHNGHSDETDLLDSFPASGPTIVWKANVGIGFSAFSIAAGHAYTAGNTDGKDTLFCFDAGSGKPLWKHSYESELGDKYFEGGPSASAAVENDRVYFNSRWGEVFCLDANTGKVIWSTNVPKETGCNTPDWGFGGSPLLYKNTVVLNMCEAGVALDKSTGKIVWKSGKKDAGYSTPFPVEFNGQNIAILGSGASYLAVNLDTGKELWRVRWMTQAGINVADPLVRGDQVMISSGYGKGSELLKMGSGDPTVVWKNREFGTHISPAVLVGDYVYGDSGSASEGGPLVCVDFNTGKQKWEYPGVGTGGIIAAGNRLFAMTEKGKLLVAAASPDGFKPTAQAQILTGKTWAPPVIADGRLYVRNAQGDCVCVDVRKK
jgi:outer membrane protein assembly factor BamB